MTSLHEELSQLADLESFDPKAFLGSDKVPQEVCSFVLSLALIYNDLKDIVLAQILLEQSRPTGQPQRSPVIGGYAGLGVHLFRLQVAQVHALLETVRENSSHFNHPSFRAVIQQLHRDSRDAWETVVRAAEGATPKSDLGRMLMMIRHKVASHYDPKMLVRGYQLHFFGGKRHDERAFLSRGDSMSDSRFYFADAAAQGVVRDTTGEDDYAGLASTMAQLIRPLNIALMHIVLAFIQRRGFGYRACPTVRELVE